MHHFSQRNRRYLWRVLQETLRDSEKNNSEQEESDEERIPEITSEEIQAAICKLKSGKSCDGNGIQAEDIKIATKRREK